MGERKKEPTWLLKVFSSSSRGITTGRTAAFSSSPPSFDLSLTGMDKRWEGMEIFCQSVKSAKLRATNRGERKEGGGGKHPWRLRRSSDGCGCGRIDPSGTRHPYQSREEDPAATSLTLGLLTSSSSPRKRSRSPTPSFLS